MPQAQPSGAVNLRFARSLWYSLPFWRATLDKASVFFSFFSMNLCNFKSCMFIGCLKAV